MPRRQRLFATTLVTSALLAWVACGGSSATPVCTPGQSIACTCVDGTWGAQVCASGGTFGACTCGAGDAGTGSSSGSGSSSGGSGSSSGGVVDSGPSNPCDAGQSSCHGVCVDEENDPANCGACGTACSGTCTHGACLVVLASQQLAPGDLALDAKNVYFTNVGNPGIVVAVPLGGGTATTLGMSLGTPRSIAVDSTSAYTTDVTAGTIRKTPLDGSAGVGFVTMQTTPTDLVLDATASNVYWTTGTAGTVVKAMLQAGTVKTLASGLSSPDAIAVDGSHVYWSDVVDGTVMSLALAGGSPATVASGLGSPNDIAVDSKSVYWVDYAKGVVVKVGLGGGNATTLAAGQNKPDAIAVDATSVYWTNEGDALNGSVMKVPLAGGALTTLVDGLDSPGSFGGLAIDATSVYWALDPKGGTGTGAVMKLTPR